MSIAVLDSFLLLTIFLTSILVVREDIKTKRIPNKFILSAASIGLFFYMIALVTGTVNFTYFLEVMVNVFISFVVSFGIWKLGLWPAGDAKLVVTFSFLIPLCYYAQTYLYLFPSFAFLINIFFVYLSFLMVKIIPIGWNHFSDLRQAGGGYSGQRIFACYMRKKWRVILRIARRKKHAWIWRDRPRDAGNKRFAGKAFGEALIKIFIISVAVMSFERRSFQLRSFLVYFLFFGSLRILFSAFINSYGRKRIRVSEVHPGVNLSEASIKQLKADMSFFNGLDTLRAEGLTGHQASLVRDYLSSRGVVSVYVHDTIPFSPFIVSGAAVTILAKGSVLYSVSLIVGQTAGKHFGF